MSRNKYCLNQSWPLSWGTAVPKHDSSGCLRHWPRASLSLLKVQVSYARGREFFSHEESSHPGVPTLHWVSEIGYLQTTRTLGEIVRTWMLCIWGYMSLWGRMSVYNLCVASSLQHGCTQTRFIRLPKTLAQVNTTPHRVTWLRAMRLVIMHITASNREGYLGRGEGGLGKYILLRSLFRTQVSCAAGCDSPLIEFSSYI